MNYHRADLKMTDKVRSHKVWTKHSLHPKFADVGCAMLVQNASQEEYIIACTHPKSESTPDSLAGIFPIALALDHLDLDTDIELQLSDHDTDMIEKALCRKFDGELPEAVDQSLEEQADNIQFVDPEDFRARHEQILKDVAWYARKYSLDSILDLAEKNNIDIRIMTPVITEFEHKNPGVVVGSGGYVFDPPSIT